MVWIFGRRRSWLMTIKWMSSKHCMSKIRRNFIPPKHFSSVLFGLERTHTEYHEWLHDFTSSQRLKCRLFWNFSQICCPNCRINFFLNKKKSLCDFSLWGKLHLLSTKIGETYFICSILAWKVVQNSRYLKKVW